MGNSKYTGRESVSADTLVQFIDFSKISDDNKGEIIGLVPAIIQDNTSKDVLMVAFMNAAALQKTLDTGMATFWTRSRKRLWTKGEESGNFMRVVSVETDCDADTLVVKVDPQGDKRACHMGEMTCFYRGFTLKTPQ